ncbi:MAG TPA: flagellar biosynthetic protein FliO [Bdellovibrionota bacterium]|jgi:flagellar biogenesis protein FliO|nr:flagellar biosynthetic protein FliO [Bdellovibrionota bacterium]
MKYGYSLLFIAALVCLAPVRALGGQVTLRNVQVTGNQVALLFDQDVPTRDVRTEYVRNIIQITVKNASVYPAKVLAVKDANVNRIFAYQYTPGTVRIRLTMDGDASHYEKNTQIDSHGKVLTVQVGGQKIIQDTISVQSSKPVTAAQALSDSDRQRLLDKVLAPTAGAPAQQPLTAFPIHSDSAHKQTSSQPLADGKPLPSPFKAFGWLAVMLAFLGCVAIASRRLRGKIKLPRGLARITRDRDFEVVSTQSLGQKRNLMLVKVKGRLLVLGCSNDAINLITEFQDDEPVKGQGKQKYGPLTGALMAKMGSSSMGDGAEAGGPAAFAEFLEDETLRPSSLKPESMSRATTLKEPPQTARPAGQKPAANPVRESIRRRIEGMKSL